MNLLPLSFVPPVEIGKFFEYLGRCFNFSMDKIDHKTEVLRLISDLMSKIDKIPCLPKNKLLLYYRFILSKFRGILLLLTLARHELLKT